MILLSLIPIVTGGLLATQTAVNSRLRSFVGSPFLASTVLFSVGALFLLALAFFMQGSVHFTTATFSDNPWWIWTGGLLGSIVLTVNILLFPKLGGVQTAVLPIFGQIIMGLLIDQFGLLSSPLNPLTVPRLLGFVFVLIGVLLTVIRKQSSRENKQKSVLLWQMIGVLAGMLSATQTAVNGYLGTILGSSLQAAAISFSTGTIILLVYCLGTQTTFADLGKAVSAGKSYWWIWIGGFLGGLYVFGSDWLVPQIGTGQVVVMALFGQLTFSAIIDQFGFFHALKSPVSRQKLLGLVIMFIGVILTKMA